VIVLDPNRAGPGVPVAQNLSTRAYDVSDLVDSEGNDAKRETKMNQLIELISSTVAVDSWIAEGGSSSIKAFNAKLVVSAPESSHREVARVLEMLREKPAPRIAP
jgi:hypothetical protein